MSKTFETATGPFIEPFNDKRALLELPLLIVFNDTTMTEPHVELSVEQNQQMLTTLKQDLARPDLSDFQRYHINARIKALETGTSLDELTGVEDLKATKEMIKGRQMQEGDFTEEELATSRQQEEAFERSEVQTTAAIQAKDELMKRLMVATPEKIMEYAKREGREVVSVTQEIEDWKKTKAVALYQQYKDKNPGYRMVSFLNRMEELNINLPEAATLYQEVMTKPSVLAGTKELLPSVLDKAMAKQNILRLFETFQYYEAKGKAEDLQKALIALTGAWTVLQEMKRQANARRDFTLKDNIDLIMKDMGAFAKDFASSHGLTWEVEEEQVS